MIAVSGIMLADDYSSGWLGEVDSFSRARSDRCFVVFTCLDFFAFFGVVASSVSFENFVLFPSALVRPGSELLYPCGLIWFKPGLFVGPYPWGPPV